MSSSQPQTQYGLLRSEKRVRCVRYKKRELTLSLRISCMLMPWRGQSCERLGSYNHTCCWSSSMLSKKGVWKTQCLVDGDGVGACMAYLLDVVHHWRTLWPAGWRHALLGHSGTTWGHVYGVDVRCGLSGSMGWQVPH